MSLCGNLDLFLNHYANNAYFQSRNFCLRDFGRRPRPIVRDAFKLSFSVTLLNSLADFTTEIHFSYEKPISANTPIVRFFGANPAHAPLPAPVPGQMYVGISAN